MSAPSKNCASDYSFYSRGLPYCGWLGGTPLYPPYCCGGGCRIRTLVEVRRLESVGNVRGSIGMNSAGEGVVDSRRCIPGLEEEVRNFAEDLRMLATCLQN